MRNLKEETFYLASYFDSRMMGLDDNYQTSDETEAEDWAWEHLNQGGYVEIKNQKTGKEVYLDPDDLLFDYDDYASGAFEDAINDSGVFIDPEWHDTADQEQVDQTDYIPDGMDESMGKEIKRYSDVYSDERRNQGWWYFTTHGVQPGSVPKGVNILEVRDTPNGTYFRADAILNTSELEYYDIKERVPKEEESLNRKSGKKLTEAPDDEKEQGKKPAEDNAEVDPDKGSGDAEKEQKIKQKYLEFIKQLKSAKDYNSYLQLLRKICQDDNSRKILFWGIQKGIDGNGQNAVKGQVKVTALLPTQNEIGVNDSLAYPLEKDPSGIPKLFKNPVQVGPNPIVVFNDGARNYVLDGHHRWSQVYMFNPNATMSAFILKKGFATGPVGALKNLQLIIGAGTGNVPSSDANGINIYTASEDQLKNWIAQRLKNSVGQRALEIFNKATGQQLDANGLLEYFMKNILTLKKTTGTWAKKMPPRSEMPQTNKGPDGVAGTIGYADNVVTESKKPANTKINIRESLNKHDLRTDNKYDLRNLYDACIMTDKEKRIIAEMISKNTRANVLYEALMNKFEGKPLNEAPDEYVQLADMPRKERQEEEYTVTIWDSSDGRREFFNSLDDAIECAWEAMTNGLYAKIEGAGQRVMLSPQEVLSGYDCIRRHIEEVFGEWEVESLKESTQKKSLKESHEVEYLEGELAEKSLYPSIEDAYERNELTICKFKDSNTYYLQNCPNRLYRLVKREMGKYYPELKYLYDESLKESPNNWGTKIVARTKNGYIQRNINKSNVFNDVDYYILFDKDGNFVKRSIDFNELKNLLYKNESLKESKSLKEEMGPYEFEPYMEKIAYDAEEGYFRGEVDGVDWEITFNGHSCNDFKSPEFLEYMLGQVSYPIRDGHLNYYDLDNSISRDMFYNLSDDDISFMKEDLKNIFDLEDGDFEEFDNGGDLEWWCDYDVDFDTDEWERITMEDDEEEDEYEDEDDYDESLKEGVNDRLRQKAEPLANALDELTDRDDGFYITYSIGMDDNGAVTGGVDFELFKSSRTEEEAKAEIERVFDENGFELDRRFKTNPGKTWMGNTHYQIIEKDK